LEGIIIGSFDDVSIEERELLINPGDVLLFFTDGVTEATNASGELFGTNHLTKLLEDHQDESAEKIAQVIHNAINHFTGSTPQSDDLTILVLRRLPTP